MTANSHRRICINEDNGHFYSSRAPKEISRGEIESLVDFYAKSQVGQMLFCVNVRRALFDSRKWEPVFTGYDPDGPDDQPCLDWLPEDQRRLDTVNEGRRQLHNLRLMKDCQLDHFAIWLERCRKHNIQGFLSIRMNDCHYSNDLNSHWHSSFWKNNPQLRIVTHRDPRKLGEHALDYTKKEVRDYSLGLIRELFERYDMDGIELDWMRFGLNLPYGKCRSGAHFLTEFIKEVCELSRICSKRTGKPMSLAVRVPPTVETCLSLGYDVLTWIKQELVQQITISNFLCDHWLDYPVETWKAVIGDHPVALGVCFHAGITDPAIENGSPRTKKWLQELPDIVRGAAGAALVKGADLIYLFNHCYYEHDTVNPQRVKYLQDIIHTCGSIASMSGLPRRHILTYQQFAAPGEPDRRKIPVSLRPGSMVLSSRIDNIIPLRFNIGPAAGKNERARLLLGFDNQAAETAGEKLKIAKVWLNDIPCATGEAVISKPNPVSSNAALIISWQLPEEALHPGENYIEFEAPDSTGSLTWAEIIITQPHMA